MATKQRTKRPKARQSPRRPINLEPVGGWPKTGLATTQQAIAFLAVSRAKLFLLLSAGRIKRVEPPVASQNRYRWEDLWKIHDGQTSA
ncbi:MAG: hypothetical protein NT069_32855 [Planctomycetota bacterium]|nr:hypothetical protein [Planctomycetota bacterium]